MKDNTVKKGYQTLIDSNGNLIFTQQKITPSLKLLTEHEEALFTLTSLKRGKAGFVFFWSGGDYGELIEEWQISEGSPILKAHFKVTAKFTKNLKAIFIREWAFQAETTPYFMIPGHLYGSNNLKNSKGLQPQLNYRGDISYPKTPVFRTRADRSTHNAVIAQWSKLILAVQIQEVTSGNKSEYYNGLCIDTRNFDVFDRIGFTLGYHHFPVQYKGKIFGQSPVTEEPVLNFIPFTKEKTYTAHGRLYLAARTAPFGWEKAVQWFYEQIHQPPANDVPRQEAVSVLARALVEDAYDKAYKYFPTVVSGSHADTCNAGDMSWTGGMQVIYPLLRASGRVPQAKSTILDFVNNLINNGIHPSSGFFYESRKENAWRINGWWSDHVTLYDRTLKRLSHFHSSYINGQAVCYLLKSYQYAQASGWDQKEYSAWLKPCLNILAKVIAQQRYDGALGVYFDPNDGTALSYNSFQSAWFFAALAEAYDITGDHAYLKVAENSEGFYFGLLEKGELWGTPMDTGDAVDEEGNLAYVTGLATLHKATGKKKYLDHLLHALHYEFSWKFAYNTRFENEPLKSLHWSSCGGSITSSHNLHIHQMGNLIAEEMYYAYQQTKDPYILSRLKDTLNWGLGTFNRHDGQFGFGKKGWATEQFFHTDAVQDDPNRIPDGGIWKDYLSWAAACVLLSSVADIPDEYYG